LLVLATIAIVAVVSYLLSRPVPDKGIALFSPFTLPVTAAAVALLLDPERAAPTPYIGGTFGALIGADLMTLGRIKRLRMPIAAIGGVGTFDVVFTIAVLDVLLT